MPDHEVRLSRSRLIQGIFATSMLAACGGGSASPGPGINPSASPTPALGTCPQIPVNSADRYGLDAVLRNDIFSQIDRQWLLDTFDPAPHIEKLQQNYLTAPCVHVQQGNTITSIPSAGICITTAGTYTLSASITWTPTATGTAAITIQASNVTLDLGGHTLSAFVVDTSLQTNGISIVGPLANISIMNGTIAAFTEHGILADHVCGLTISGITVSGLCLQNLSQRFLTPSGILVAYGLNVVLSNCTVTGSDVTTDASAAFQFLSTNYATITNCTASSLINRDGAVQGFSYVGCTYVITSSCTATGFQSFFDTNVLTSGHTVIGFLPTFCNNLTFEFCTATSMTGCCDDSHGMSIFLNWIVTVQNFTASGILDGVNNIATHTNSGAKATGLEIYSFGNVKALDCSVTGVRAINPEDLQAAGFSAWGPSIAFERCTATNISVKNDTAQTDVRGIGFGWAPDPRPEFNVGAYFILYLDCQANSCDVAFDTWDHVLSTWSRTTYTNCAIGYLVEPNATRTISCDGCSECIVPIPQQPLKNIASGNTYPV